MVRAPQPRPEPEPEPTVAMVAVGRPTFDLGSAAPLVEQALADLQSLHPSAVGDRIIRTTAGQVEDTVRDWPTTIRTVVVVLATFADSTLAAAAVAPAEARGLRLVLWSFPEQRLTDRLSWNSLCGSILAAFRFHPEPMVIEAVHATPGTAATVDRLATALDPLRPEPDPGAEGAGTGPMILGRPTAEDELAAERIAERLGRARIGIVGRPPDGFEPCRVTVDPSPIGARFETIQLEELFSTAEESLDARPGSDVDSLADHRVNRLAGIEQREPIAVGRSLGLHDALGGLAADRRWDGLALRCWPECFDRWGGAACAPLSFLSDGGTPGACEADGYGALTALLMQLVSGRPAFLADLVDIDPGENTGVFWHCGVAPASMADPGQPVAAIDHPNRKMPLALGFGLGPGPVTIARISQSEQQLRLAVGFGRMLGGPAPFTGTSGTVRFDRPVEQLLRTIIDQGLEHHFILATGDHRMVLTALAARWQLALVPLTS